ncbi:MAG TPA: cupin domain-containing protein [Gemmataceae bacterium]|nr:cupin domain-containing protein [Gemmataceae bacterium]
MSELNRRQAIGSAAAVAGGLVAGAARAEPVGKEAVEELPTFRFAMERQAGRATEGGYAREATVKQLPISTGLAGVSMRLKPGGFRELHWHANAAEWAFVVKGRVRTTVLGPDGQSETNDFDPGDVWYFPRGHGHAVQNLGREEAHFILIFDDGGFSEYRTFSATDWLGHTPVGVLAKNLGLPEAALAKLPRDETFIPLGRVPDPAAPPRQPMRKASPQTHRYPLMEQPPLRFAGGEERRVSAREFPVSKTMTGVVLDLKPGALRELHWHPHANEWLYFVSGGARMGLFGSHGRYRAEDFGPGDAGYIPRGFGHYIENTGDTTCRVLVAFDSGEYQEISLSAWLASNPIGLVADHFHLSDAVAEKLPDHRVFVVPKEGPGK